MSDLISRQAAIDGKITAVISGQAIEAIPESYIKQLPSAQPTYTEAEIQKMQDLEQAQLDKVYQLGYEEGKQAAQAQGMKSRWYDGRCLRCGEHAPFHPMASAYYESNFCPNCGAYMRGGQDE